MVVRANRVEHSIGGHISTFASAATLFEVGFNHFFRARTDEFEGDTVYFQGHAAPGVYARAFLRAGYRVEKLENFRRELQAGGGLVFLSASVADAGFLGIPHRVHGPRPDHGHLSGPLQPLPGRSRPEDPHGRKVWAFLGDGETDEPETLGAITWRRAKISTT